VVIPLSDKDAKDLQRWNNEQENQRRINTRGSKATRRSAVPGLRDLNKMLRERPFGAGSGQSSASTEKPLMVSREKDRFGKYKNVPVGLPEGQRNLINSIKFDKFGDAVVNGRYAPELTNTLKSMIKGTLQVPSSGLPTGAIFTEPPQALDTGRRSNLPTGVIGYDSAGRPIMSKSMAPRSTTPFIADGVRVTDSLLRNYITQLEKNSGVTGTTPFSSRQLGPELYNRLFGSAETQTVRNPMKREPTVINVRKLAANAYEGEKFTVKNLPKDAIYVGRAYSKGKYQLQGTPYGNPYRVGPDGQLDEVLSKYETWARNKLAANPKWLDPLVGKDLVDWCEPGKCHADVLKKLVKEKVGDFERVPLTGKTQLSNIEQSRARLKQLQDLKKSVGGGNLSRAEAAELSRLQETIRKATTLDPTLTEVLNTRTIDDDISDPLIKKDIQKIKIQSGGATGADTEWARVASKFGMSTTAHGFQGMKVGGGTPEIYTPEQLKQNDAFIKTVNEKHLNRIFPMKPTQYRDVQATEYANNLIRRNFYQVQNADAVIAIGRFKNGKVDGGSGWAAYMGIEQNKPVYVFDQEKNKWFEWKNGKFVQTNLNQVKSFTNFAGIGSRNINANGIRAIENYMNKVSDSVNVLPKNSGIVSEKTKPETKVSIKNIGDTKAPGIYTDGKYNPKVTYNAIQAIIKMNESAKYRQVIGRQGGIRIGNVFVAVEDMQQLAKSIPTGQKVIYNKKGNPTIKPTSKPGGGAFFGIVGKVIGPLSIAAFFSELVTLSQGRELNPYADINPQDVLK
jgi:nucleoside 2-deoxyribosyltransferase